MVDRGVLLVRVGAQDLDRLAHVVVYLGGLGLGELRISRRVVVVRHALALEHRERDRLQVTVQLIREPIDERLVILLLPRLLSRAHTPRVACAQELDEGALVVLADVALERDVEEQRVGLRGLEHEELGEVRIPVRAIGADEL